MNYDSVLDLHTHTLASGHAYNTIREMARMAADKGLQALGITEHAPKMPGTCHRFYFQNLKVVPREMYGIRLLMGSEVNILDAEGHMDLSEEEIRQMDVVIASLHVPCFTPGTKEENTMAYVNAMKHPYINIIGHPDDSRYPVDYRILAEAAREYGKVLELNNHSLVPTSFRQNARENDLQMLECCKELKVPVVMSSDAHFDVEIADFACARQLIIESAFPEELVLNRSLEALEGHVNRRIL